IQQILITGHSLAAGTVPYFMEALPDRTRYQVRAFTDGSPGAEVDQNDPRLEHFVHPGLFGAASPYDHIGDPVPMLGDATQFQLTLEATVLAVGLFLHWKAPELLADLADPALNLLFDMEAKVRAGTTLNIDSDVSGLFFANGIFGGQHNENVYMVDLARLL